MEKDFHYVVEWIDEDGNGHWVEFHQGSDKTREAFVKAIAPLAMMLHVYRVTKERL